MHRLVFVFGFLLIAGAVIGCSSSSGPVTPPSELEVITSQALESDSSRVLWGMWQVNIDPVTLEPEIVPIRGVALGCNITKFLQPPISPTHMLSIAIQGGSDPAAGFLIVDVSILHPFPGLVQYRGFDVRGILMSDGTSVSGIDPGIIYPSDSETRLLNADGYTRWWNSTEFTSYETIFGFTQGAFAPPVLPSATLNGYKYFTDGLTADDKMDDIDPANRGTFGVSPGVNNRRYEIQFRMDSGSPVYSFNYAIDASWHFPDPAFAPEYPVEAYPLSANCNEAYWLNADFDGSTAWYVDSTSSAGDLHIALEVGFWRALEPDIDVPDLVQDILVESPELNIPAQSVLGSSIVSDGNGMTSSVYTFDIPGVVPSNLTDQTLLVAVESIEPPNYQPQIPGGDVFDFPDTALTGYHMFEVPISDAAPTIQPIVLSIDPNIGVLDSGDLQVSVVGQDFLPDAYVQFVKNDNPGVVLEADGEVVDPGGTNIDCILDMNFSSGALPGIYHVKVTNPGPPPASGQLDDGFEIIEITSCDQVYESLLYEGVFEAEIDIYDGYQHTFDLAFTRDGLLLAKDNSGSGNIWAHDVTQNGTAPGTPVIENMINGQWAIVSIDVDDLTGNIIYVAGPATNTDPANNNFIAYTSEGDFIALYINHGTSQLNAIDTDFDGGIWTIGHSGSSVRLNHYIWDATVMQYQYDAIKSIDVSSQLGSESARIFDCAVSYSDRRLLVFSQDAHPYAGRITCYDLSGITPVYDPDHSVSGFLPQVIGAHGYGDWRMACDIEIDHSNPDYENCRVIIMERCQPWAQGNAFVKMDTDGNVIDTWENPGGYPDEQYYSVAINPFAPDPNRMYLACVEDNSWGTPPSYPGEYHIYEMPTGW